MLNIHRGLQCHRSLRWLRGALVVAFIGCAPANLSAAAEAAATIRDIRIWHAPHRSQVVFDMDTAAVVKNFALQNPARVVLDFHNLRLRGALPANRGPFIRKMRANTSLGNTTRVVFELAKPARYKIKRFKPVGAYRYRLMVELFPPNAAAATDPSPPKSRPRNAKLLVLIDPGHGGEDPGAVGRRVHEKTIVLQIARKIQQRLNRQPGLRAELTRRGDYYISLRGRLTQARRLSADLFISIHADAFTDPAARGASVYALSRRGASSETAKWLADKENAADLIGGVQLANKEDDVAEVLLSMSMDKTVDDSVQFGREVLAELKKIGRVHSPRVEQAGFVVLKSPDIPSILIETAYITNPAEEKLLRSEKHQRRIAAAVVKGIQRYIQKNRVRYANR